VGVTGGLPPWVKWGVDGGLPPWVKWGVDGGVTPVGLMPPLVIVTHQQ